MSGHPKQFVIYKDDSGEFRWRLFSQNSKIIADSGEGYKNKADCVHGVNLVSSIANGAAVYDAEKEVWIS